MTVHDCRAQKQAFTCWPTPAASGVTCAGWWASGPTKTITRSSYSQDRVMLASRAEQRAPRKWIIHRGTITARDHVLNTFTHR